MIFNVFDLDGIILFDYEVQSFPNTYEIRLISWTESQIQQARMAGVGYKRRQYSDTY